MVLIKLSAFHKVNIRWGYAVADQAIQAAYQSLQGILRDPIRLYRVGSTKFGFIVSRLKFPSLIKVGIERAVTAMEAPLALDCGNVTVEARAGPEYPAGREL